MELSREQQIVFDKYVQGHNIFITGPGGSGKSELIRLIYKHALKNFKNICVTALTGCASILLNCKAKTLHSWAGIGLGNGTIESLVIKIKRNNFAKKIWNETDILIVDEVSMLSMKLFDTLNAIGKLVRNNHNQFGGIQVIFSGDFYQLPPVGNYLEPSTQSFCFESDDWFSVFNYDNQIELQKIFRQTDEIYSTILNQIREGKIKHKSNDILLKYVGRELEKNLIVEPTRLFPTRNKVEQINNFKMASLNTEMREYKIKYETNLEMTKGEKEIRRKFSENEIKLELDFLAGNLLCDKEIKLKKGSQVMSVININSEQGVVLICNGSQGIINSYCEITGFPVVKYNNGIEMVMSKHCWASEKIPGIGVSQVPLILAWALTIHKSQGASLDVAEIDVGSGIFECGQTYVALSRVRSLNGLYLTSYDHKRIMINKKVRNFYESLKLYHNSKEKNEKPSISLVITEPILKTSDCINYQYEIGKVELSENVNISNNIKIIKINK